MEGVCYQAIPKSPAQVNKDSSSKRKMIFERLVLHRAIESGALHEKNHRRSFIHNNTIAFSCSEKGLFENKLKQLNSYNSWPHLQDAIFPDLVEMEKNSATIASLKVEQTKLLGEVLGHPGTHRVVRCSREWVRLVLWSPRHRKELLASLVVKLTDKSTAAIPRRMVTIHPNRSGL